MFSPSFMTQREIERDYFVASCYFGDLPKGTKFYTHEVTFSLEYEKVTKTDAVIRERKSRFYRPKSRFVYLFIPKEKFVDFCQKRNYKYKTPSTEELIKLHNTL